MYVSKRFITFDAIVFEPEAPADQCPIKDDDKSSVLLNNLTFIAKIFLLCVTCLNM